MSEHEQSMMVRAKPDQILDFIADVGNLPKYVPTTKAAQKQGENRVRVQGEANRQAYDNDGYLRCDRQARRLEWGSDEGHYSGWMQVDPSGDGASVTAHISFRGARPGATAGNQPSDETINQSLIKSLTAIRSHFETTGRAAEPTNARRS